MDYTFSPTRSLMGQLAEWAQFWLTIAIAMLIVGAVAYGMGKDAGDTGSNQRGSVENSAPADPEGSK